MMRSKIHQARVTAIDPDYEGSISIGTDLLRKADIVRFEQVHVLNAETGTRVVTYAIEATDPGTMQVNGAAAHGFTEGDRVIVIAYTLTDDVGAELLRPRIVLCDEANRPRLAEGHR
ncbi:MAG TPA: aspartate 1-decarboxylase [Actinomycetota bacterium]